jgi:multimeric flavodoxin WrbA
VKVLLINTSEYENDVLSDSLRKLSDLLEADGIETELLWTGEKALTGCTGCGRCIKKNRCVHEDLVNVTADQANTFDGWIIGCEVLFGALSEQADHFLKRLMISANNHMSHKTVLAVLKTRRVDDHEAETELRKYFDQAASVYPENWCLNIQKQADLSAAVSRFEKTMEDSYEERKNAVPAERLTGFTR